MKDTYDDLLEGFSDAAFWRQPAPHVLLDLRGPDAVEFLHRLCSQDITGMAAGEVRPAAFLNGKGKLLATCLVGRLAGDRLMLETPQAQLEALFENLDRYHFTERLAIERRPDLVCGEVLGAAVPARLGQTAGSCAVLAGSAAVVMSGARGRLSWVRYHAPAGFFVAPPWAELGLGEMDANLAECLRIANGIAAVGVDTDATTLALEANLDDHVSTTKGCYTGQEIVARIHTYGHVNRKLCTLLVAGPAAEPARGVALVEPEDGVPVGRLMSSALLPDGQRRLALGYLPADFWPAGTHLQVGSQGGPDAQVWAGLGPAPATAR